jgi:hypothetical protein
MGRKIDIDELSDAQARKLREMAKRMARAAKLSGKYQSIDGEIR